MGAAASPSAGASTPRPRRCSTSGSRPSSRPRPRSSSTWPGSSYISSAGIRVLVKARKALEARGGGVAVAHLQPPVRRVIDILKAVPSIDIFADDAQMDAFIERMQRRAT